MSDRRQDRGEPGAPGLHVMRGKESEAAEALPPAPVLPIGAERIEKMVADVLRSARDEKIALQATLDAARAEADALRKTNAEVAAAFAASMADMSRQVQSMQDKFATALDKVSTERDGWRVRATQLETELRSIKMIADESFRAKAANGKAA
jgi:hypothetical protein